MPFDTRAGFKLTLAVAAAISAQALQAQESAERLWSCNLTPSGEWDCDVNQAPVQQQPHARETSKASAEPPAEHPVADTRPSKEGRNLSTRDIPDAGDDPAAAPAPINWPASARQPRRTTPPGRATAAAAPPGTPEWQCDAGTQSWDCKRVSGSAPITSANTPSPTITPASAAALDWYAYAPGEAPGACRGRYIEPDFDYIEDDRPFDQQPVYIEALSSSSVIGGVTEMEGGIQIQRGNRLITSARGEYDQSSNNATLFGQIQYREPGLLMLSEQADANILSGDTRFYNAQYVLHQEHMRGQAAQITRFGDRRIRLDEGAVTYCEPDSNAWQIAANQIELDPKTGRGTARHATLDVAGIPVLYTPYLSFPIDDRRQSGFLYPRFGYSKSDGLDIAVPYYFNIAENIDDTLTVRHIGERGLVLENEFRYMNSWSHNTLSNAWLGSDQQHGDDRWLFGFEHAGRPADQLFSRINFTRVSDDDYFEDLGTSLEVQRDDHLDQLFQLRYQMTEASLTLRTQSYQTIDGTVPYEKLPQVLLKGQHSVLDEQIHARYQAEYVQFKRDLDSRYARGLSALDRSEGGRLHLRPSLDLRLDVPWGYLRPSATLWHSSYELDNDRLDSLNGSRSISAGIFSIDSGLILERDFALADGQYTQTLEPRLFLLHADVDADDQADIPRFDSSQLDFTYYNLFHETGWSGSDRVADTQQATLGLSSAVYSAEGIEKLRLGVAQAHYLADRENAGRPGDHLDGGTESSSNLATLANWNFTRNLRLTHNGELDRDSYEFLEHNYKLSYTPGDKRLLYMSYRDDVEKDALDGNQQLDLAFRWPLSNSWTGYGRWQQDLENNENLETLLGLEYSSCCWKVRLTGRSWVVDPDTVGSAEEFETDNGFFLQFVLRGLGTFGQDDGREYLEEITGYNEDDNGAF